jgi:S1-C subfamily serine protease
MLMRVKSAVLSLACASALALGFSALASADLPPLPDPASASTPPAGPNVLLERARRGIVTVERGGQAAGIGTVLPGDGRIVTSLAALGGSERVEVRYADGTTAQARMTAHEASWDLALLTPQSHWTEGLMPSAADPAAAQQLAAFVASRGAPQPIAAPFKGRIEARSKEGDLLVDAIELDTRRAPALGTPIVDATGSVVAVIVRACKDQTDGGVVVGACSELQVGAPMQAVRHFLFSARSPAPSAPATGAPTASSAAPASTAPQPWLGIRGEADTNGAVHGVRVIAVAGQSPAESAGLKPPSHAAPGDLIVAVDAQPVDSPEKLASLISKHTVGDTVKLLVFGEGRFREVNVVLRAAQM